MAILPGSILLSAAMGCRRQRPHKPPLAPHPGQEGFRRTNPVWEGPSALFPRPTYNPLLEDAQACGRPAPSCQGNQAPPESSWFKGLWVSNMFALLNDHILCEPGKGPLPGTPCSWLPLPLRSQALGLSDPGLHCQLRPPLLRSLQTMSVQDDLAHLGPPWIPTWPQPV